MASYIIPNKNNYKVYFSYIHLQCQSNGCKHSPYWLLGILYCQPQLGTDIHAILSPSIVARDLGFWHYFFSEASSQPSSHFIVSSIKIIFFLSSDHKTTSGLRLSEQRGGTVAYLPSLSRLFVVIDEVDGFFSVPHKLDQCCWFPKCLQFLSSLLLQSISKHH